MKCKCEVWSVGCEECNVKSEESVCIAPVSRAGHVLMFLAATLQQLRTASHKARTHSPGWSTAHARCLVVVLGSDSWKLA